MAEEIGEDARGLYRLKKLLPDSASLAKLKVAVHPDPDLLQEIEVQPKTIAENHRKSLEKLETFVQDRVLDQTQDQGHQLKIGWKLHAMHPPVVEFQPKTAWASKRTIKIEETTIIGNLVVTITLIPVKTSEIRLEMKSDWEFLLKKFRLMIQIEFGVSAGLLIRMGGLRDILRIPRALSRIIFRCRWGLGRFLIRRIRSTRLSLLIMIVFWWMICIMILNPTKSTTPS